MKRKIRDLLLHGLPMQQAAAIVMVGLFNFIVAALTIPQIALARGYEEQTRETLDHLVRSIEQFNAGNLPGSQATIQQMKSSINELFIQVKNYQALANREEERCVNRIAELDKRIGDILQQQEDLKQRIGDLNAELAKATTDQKINEQEIKRITEKLSGVLVSMAQRQASMEQLRQWWWVPGYGQYLAIQALIDIPKLQSEANTYNDELIKLQNNKDALTVTENMKTQLESQLKGLQAISSQLPEMHKDAANQMKQLRETTVFLAEAGVFWGKMDNMIKYGIDGSSKDLELLGQLLKKHTSPRFQEKYTSGVRTFKDALISFANSLDSKNNIFLEETDYCGGPPPIPSEIADSSSNCDQVISTITSYFQIVDPKTCSFRYLNPPGCPPSSETIQVDEQTIAKGIARGDWTRSSTDQNWVGRNRCASTDAIYYGKRNSEDECEKVCMSDLNCRFWTYNRNNGYMPNSINECWGGQKALPPQKSNWGGFVSGGMI